MKLRRAKTGNELHVEVLAPQGWVAIEKCLAPVSQGAENKVQLSVDMIALLAAPTDLHQTILQNAMSVEPEGTRECDVVIPFEARSFRDFMLYEAHAIAAARAFVNTYMPAAAPVVRAYEAVAKRPFPKLKPHALWYRQPIYYFGNHLNIATDGEDIVLPSYAHTLDYELELGFVLAHPLRDASADDAEKAIGGFVVLNDFSARDVQLDEMASSFGPQKSKHFASAMSKIVVTADEILPRWRSLAAHVSINGQRITDTSTAGAHWALGDMLAHASRSEQLHAGELFGTGTLPGGSGIETGHALNPGDTVEIGINGIGTLTNRIVASSA